MRQLPSLTKIQLSAKTQATLAKFRKSSALLRKSRSLRTLKSRNISQTLSWIAPWIRISSKIQWLSIIDALLSTCWSNRDQASSTSSALIRANRCKRCTPVSSTRAEVKDCNKRVTMALSTSLSLLGREGGAAVARGRVVEGITPSRIRAIARCPVTVRTMISRQCTSCRSRVRRKCKGCSVWPRTRSRITCNSSKARPI